MKSYHFNYQKYQPTLLILFTKLQAIEVLTNKKLAKLLNQYPKEPGQIFSKNELIFAYRELLSQPNAKNISSQIMKLLTKKLTRTASGVTPVTILTKTFPCPGKCIFCPSDIRMPKSYLANEPGAQRAERNYFDPYLQTYNRLLALYENGHNVDKVELIILGGTWSYYLEKYQIWFIKECFRALNEFQSQDGRKVVIGHYQCMNQRLKKLGFYQISADPDVNQKALQKKQIDGGQTSLSYNQLISQIYTAPEVLGGFDQYQTASWKSLIKQQKINELAKHRCVGLVVETRPDNISIQEIIRMRKLGATKAQIGVQSLQDEVLKKNKRGHDVQATRKAFQLLRQAGFKIHAHWMANLYGSSPQLDKKDFLQLFADDDFKPDELKIYPCSLIASAQLMKYYQLGKWRPYSHQELLEVVSFALAQTPAYCRLTRVIRDIPSTNIVVGNKKTNFRQIAQDYLLASGQPMNDIRAREIRDISFIKSTVQLIKLSYKTSVSEEFFLQFVVPKNRQPAKIIAFLRLSFPKDKSFISELENSALIREIHVYGQAVMIGDQKKNKPQHVGYGTKLMVAAQKLAKDRGYKKIAVISAIGTKQYYRKKGFYDGELYQFIDLN